MPRKAKQPANEPAPETVLHLNVPIVEVAEGWLLDTLLADASVSRYVLARLSERVAVVAPDKIDVLLPRLRKLGHTPKVLAE